MTDDTTLGRLPDIADGSAKGFTIDNAGEKVGILIARRGERLFAYRNICPHKGLNLDWLPDAFMDSSGEYIHCANHDALFRVEDGYCVSGPCLGASLRAYPIRIRCDGIIETDLGKL